jgi:hypothetical protein
MSHTGPHQKPEVNTGAREEYVAHYSSRAHVFTSSFRWGPVLLITLREHLCSLPFFDGVRCCSLLFASTCVHLRFLMGSGVAHYSSRAPVFTSSFWWGPVLLITLREHLCSLPVFDGVRCCSLLFTSTCVHLQFLMGSGVAHYSSRAPVFTSSFWWGPVLLITLREHLCSPPVFDGLLSCYSYSLNKAQTNTSDIKKTSALE